MTFNLVYDSISPHALILKNKIKDKKSILEIFKQETIKNVAERFDTETDLKGSRWKEKKKSNGKKILVDSGDLSKDVIDEKNFHIKGKSIEVITNVSGKSKKGEGFFYGYAHNWGEKVKDQRQFIGNSDKLNETIENRLIGWLG